MTTKFRDGELNLPIAEYAAQNPVFCHGYFCASIRRKLKIELEIVNAIALEFVFDDKGTFVVNNANGSRVRYSKRTISSVGGAQEAPPRFSAFLYLTDGRFVSEDEKPARAGIDAILFRTTDHQSIVRGGAAEPVSCCYVASVAARARVTEDFLTAHSQNEAELIIVGMAAFAEDPVRNGEKQDFG